MARTGSDLCPKCETERKRVWEFYVGQLIAQNTTAKVIGNVEIERHEYVPDKLHGHTIEVLNCSNSAQPFTKNVTPAFRIGNSYSMTHSLTNSHSASGSWRWNFPKVGSAGITITDSRRVWVTIRQGESWSENISASDSARIDAPAKSRSRARLEMTEGDTRDFPSQSGS